MHFIRRSTLAAAAVLLAALALMALPTLAQDTATTGPPSEIEFAFADLGQRVNETITFQSIASFEWAGRRFSDTSLGCPQPGEFYNEVITPGYQFLINYAGTTYDYRVAEGGDRVVLCDTSPAQPVEPTPINGAPSPCGDTYTVRDDDTLFDIARLCNTTVSALLTANPEIDNRSVIYIGQELTIPDGTGTPPGQQPQTVTISPNSGPPGTVVQLVASDLPPSQQVNIGVGLVASEYEIVDTQLTTPDGTLNTNLTIPESASAGQEWVGVVNIGTEEYISGEFSVVRQGQPQPTATPSAPVFESTQIFLIAIGDSGQTGLQVGCDDSVIPVEVQIEPTVAPLTAAIEQLVNLDERMYGQSGLYNALHLSDLTVDQVTIEDGEAIIRLSGDFQVGGTCDAPRIDAQLRQTALQYATVDEASIYINGQLLEETV